VEELRARLAKAEEKGKLLKAEIKGKAKKTASPQAISKGRQIAMKQHYGASGNLETKPFVDPKKGCLLNCKAFAVEQADEEAKLLEAEIKGKVKKTGTTQALSKGHQMAMKQHYGAPGNQESKPLKKAAMKKVWLSASMAASKKAAANTRAHTPPLSPKKEQVAKLLEDVKESLAAEAAATNAALMLSASKKAAANSRGHTPTLSTNKVKVAKLLRDVQESLTAEAGATRAALMLLENQQQKHQSGSLMQRITAVESGERKLILDANLGEGTREEGGRGRGRAADDHPADAEAERFVAAVSNATSVNCSIFDVTNETACIPQECNVTELNAAYHSLLPACIQREADSSAAESEPMNASSASNEPEPRNITEAEARNTSEAASEEAMNNSSATSAASRAPLAAWNEPMNTSDAYVDSGAAGVVKGEVSVLKPHTDTIYCYDDDDTDGGFTRHARPSSYCWAHRAYCELYCEGDIMSTPPPLVAMPGRAPDNSNYVSWRSWAKALRSLSPYALLGSNIVGEPKFNYGGINEVQPVKLPEPPDQHPEPSATLGEALEKAESDAYPRAWAHMGIVAKPYQDGR
jgi:hypothetical protein